MRKCFMRSRLFSLSKTRQCRGHEVAAKRNSKKPSAAKRRCIGRYSQTFTDAGVCHMCVMSNDALFAEVFASIAGLDTLIK